MSDDQPTLDYGALEVRSPLEEFEEHALGRLDRARRFEDDDPDIVREALELGRERLAAELGVDPDDDPRDGGPEARS